MLLCAIQHRPAAIHRKRLHQRLQRDRRRRLSLIRDPWHGNRSEFIAIEVFEQDEREPGGHVRLGFLRLSPARQVDVAVVLPIPDRSRLARRSQARELEVDYLILIQGERFPNRFRRHGFETQRNHDRDLRRIRFFRIPKSFHQELPA